MATTQLQVTALPGKPQSFLAKSPAAPSGPHTGLFTELSVSALPGQRHSFSAKTPAGEVPGGPHTGLFTELSVMALPGMRHSFTAKIGAEALPAVGVYGGGGTYDRIIERKLDRDEDFDDLMNMYINIVASGILN